MATSISLRIEEKRTLDFLAGISGGSGGVVVGYPTQTQVADECFEGSRIRCVRAPGVLRRQGLIDTVKRRQSHAWLVRLLPEGYRLVMQYRDSTI